MSRRGWPVLLTVAVLGLAGLAVSAAVDERDLAFTNGVPILRVIARVKPAQVACQTNVRVIEPFSAVELVPRRLKRALPPVSVELRERPGGRTLAAVGVPVGYADNRPLRVRVPPVAAGRRVDVCVRNRGDRRVGLEGGKGESAPGSLFVRGGEPYEHSALSLWFRRDRPRSVLSQLPTVFARASLFRPGWVGPWTFWLLLAAVAVGVPLLLARAIALTQSESPPDAPDDPSLRS